MTNEKATDSQDFMKGFQGCPCAQFAGRRRKRSVLGVLLALSLFALVAWAILSFDWALPALVVAMMGLCLLMMLSGACGKMAARCFREPSKNE